MPSFEKILVALDYSEIDDQLINIASWASKYTLATEVHFINVIGDINLPESIKEQFPNIMNDAINGRKNDIQSKIDRYFSNKAVNYKIIISAGQPTKVILEYSVTENIDLIIMGRKNDKTGSGTIINRIARRAGCSILILPKNFHRKIKKVLVPIDFSNHSQEAMKHTLAIAQNGSSNLQILAQKVYQVPSGYHYTGKSFTEFAKIMKDNVKREYEHFMSQIDTKGYPIQPIYTLDKNDDIINVVLKTANKQKVDAIVISTKGMSSTTALFLGSKAEKLIQHHSDIPLVVIRTKGEREGILEYLRNL